MTNSAVKEPALNTFITSTAVIKFSGGCTGPEEWTDSEEEDEYGDLKKTRHDLKSKTGEQTPNSFDRSSKLQSFKPEERILNESSVVNNTDKVKKDVALNGNVYDHRNGETKSSIPRLQTGKNAQLNVTAGLPQVNSATRPDQQYWRSDHQSQRRLSPGYERSSVNSSQNQRNGTDNGGVTAQLDTASQLNDFERNQRKTEAYDDDLNNPFAEVPYEKQSSVNDTWTRHEDDDRRTHSTSYDTDTDISLPSEDQDFAQITNEDLGISENHFSQPEGFFGFSKIEELEIAIENCKDAVKETREHSEQRRKLVAKLVQLRLKLMEIKEGEEIEDSKEVKVVLGHHFTRMSGTSSNDHCEVCLSVIWGMLQTWFKCTECNFGCHGKCINSVKRQCVSTRVSRTCYELNICPEKGLSPQNYRCAECRAPLAFSGMQSEPRLCDYSGLYYCNLCHWNDTEVIPARVIHNWDFDPRRVSRQSKQLLRLMCNRAVLRIQDLNPVLFNYVEELSQIKKLRGEILIMKKYFLSCRRAMESKLLKQLQDRPHFVENSDMFSLQDLIDTHEGNLITDLATIHGNYAVHIRIDCQLCQAKGFICELCNADEVLYPFDMIASVCSKCYSVYHRDCFYKMFGECPKCARLSRRLSTEKPSSSPTVSIPK